jgi:flagellar motor switch protein FliN/FliY
MTIGNLVDSNIMQILPISTAKKIVSIMMGNEEVEPTVEAPIAEKIVETKPEPIYEAPSRPVESKTIVESSAPKVEVHEARFEPLVEGNSAVTHKNIDLILDVPLDISVVLGRTKKSIKEILSLGTGSLIELQKLAEEPVEILVNGKKIAYGEVVVVDENFGVRITNIVSNAERIKSLK